ncbi:histone-lysine N-methyltransferase SETMAR [Trichonephila clavipes]|nr:histone-lysine N-methyltransferase SETMAR [Trichonephila clavipes]
MALIFTFLGLNNLFFPDNSYDVPRRDETVPREDLACRFYGCVSLDRIENGVETREYYRAMIFYDFKAGLNEEEYVQRLQLAFGDESPCHATVFKWFKEFCSGHNSLQDEEHTGRAQLE